MNKTALLGPAKSVEWETPIEVFEALNQEFHFDTDVCSDGEKAKCSRFITPSDSLNGKEWGSVNWLNPPYGRMMTKFIQRAYEETKNGRTTVCLIPSRTDTRLWHEYVMRGEIRFIKGRLKFGGHKNPAPFPSCIVIFRGNPRETNLARER